MALVTEAILEKLEPMEAMESAAREGNESITRV